MYDPKILAEPFKRNNNVLDRQVVGLTHADSLRQPEPRGNCLNYVIGHILVGRDNVLEMLGAERLLSEDEKERYDTDAAPITVVEDGVIAFERLLVFMRESSRLIEEALSALTAEELAGEAKFGKRNGPLGHWIEFLGWHDTYHIGQTEYLRQLAGTDDKVI